MTFDSGALIAAEKGDRRFWALWNLARARGARVTVPAPVLAQVWRRNNPVVALVLQGCDVSILDEHEAKRIGSLLDKSRTADVVDAAVVVGANGRHDTLIVTSDPGDIGRLVNASGNQSIKVQAV